MKGGIFNVAIVSLLSLASADVHSGHNHAIHERMRPLETTPVTPPNVGSVGSGNSTNSSCPGYIDGFGLSYSPAHANQSIKTQSEVNADFRIFTQAEKYKLVRLYGSNDHQTALTMKAAKAHGIKVMAAVYDIHKVADEIRAIISDVKGDWDMIHTVAVGNEVINDKKASVRDVKQAVRTARHMLNQAGYHGCVVAVDVFSIFLQPQNEQLCDISDYVAANAHGYFDGSFPGSGDGEWLSKTHKNLEQACHGKNVTITETGWPTAGDPKKQAQPGKSAQRDALSSIKEKFPGGNVIFFEYEDDLWKAKDDNPLHIEQHFGMYKKGYNPLVPVDNSGSTGTENA